MADGLEQAAQAFDRAIAGESGKASPSPKPISGDSGPIETLFKNSAGIEVDEESPAVAGGDLDLDPEAAVYQDTPRKSPKREDEEGTDESDEGADDEREPEEDEEDEEDGEDLSPEDAEFLGQEVQVTVDGEPITVKMKEALEGYVRTETFHRRMNEVEEAKKVVQQVGVDAIAQYEYAAKLVEEMQEHLNTMIPPEPNWDDEFKKNPMRARELQKYYEGVRNFRGVLQKRMNDARQEQMKANASQLAAYAQTETQKWDRMNNKAWATDPKRKSKDLQAMRRTALSQGFSDEEIAQVYDSRMLQILLKASKYDRIMASKPQPVRKLQGKKVPNGQGGPPRLRTSRRGYSKAMKQLNRTGSIEDAAVVFDEILRRE